MKAVIGHIILNVKGFSESELFYDKFLTEIGFKIDHRNEGEFEKMKFYKQGDHSLWIWFDRSKESEKFVRNVGLDHLAFELNSETEVDDVYELVKKMNVKTTRKPKKHSEYSTTYYAFYFRDPNEIPLEIYMQ
ncbi:MAG: VOC family protein [Flavobacteriales bacterium]|nr:VOC family protein [Flavobacteriales bacterium]